MFLYSYTNNVACRQSMMMTTLVNVQNLSFNQTGYSVFICCCCCFFLWWRELIVWHDESIYLFFVVFLAPHTCVNSRGTNKTLCFTQLYSVDMIKFYVCVHKTMVTLQCNHPIKSNKNTHK